MPLPVSLDQFEVTYDDNGDWEWNQQPGNPITTGESQVSNIIKLDRVGSDVEMFLVDKDKNPVPCVGVVPGTKEQPHPLSLGEGFAIQEDNVMLEYNIPAAKDAYAFVYSIQRIQEVIAKEHLAAKGLYPVIVPSMHFSPEQLKSRQARTAGCDPDFCVWEKKINEAVELDKEMRGAGGHIHISFTVDGKPAVMPAYLTAIELVVMMCDVFIGVPGILIDKDRERRKWYGKAGAFRPREYGKGSAGVEYRVPSNFWTATPRLSGWIYEQTQKAVEKASYLMQVGAADNTIAKYKDRIIKAINECDEPCAKRVIADWHVQMPA